jgi:phage-related protein
VYKIVLYSNAQGNSPVADFIADLDERALTDKSARIQLEQLKYCVERLKISGTRSGSKFTKQIDGKIWELRPGENRVFFFYWNSNHIVLLHHFRKETKKTPQQEIEQAKRELADWIERNNGQDEERGE